MSRERGAEVLVIRLGSLGDVVLTFPALALLRVARPAARIVVLVKEAYAPLVATHPAVDEVIMLTAGERGLGGAMALARRLRARRFAAVFDLQGSPRSRFVVALSGARARRHRASRALGRRLLVAAAVLRRLLRRAPPPPVPAALVPPAAALAAARAVDPAVCARHELPGPELRLPEGAVRAASTLLSGRPRPVIALCPGTRHATKGWHGYGELARDLTANGACVVIVLGPGETWPEPSGEAIIIARGSLVELAAVLGGADAVVGNDSGLTHVATACGTPAIVLFGPTVPALGFLPVGPHRVAERFDLNCRPCSVHGRRRCPRGDQACLAGISVGQVRALLDQMRLIPAEDEAIHAR